MSLPHGIHLLPWSFPTCKSQLKACARSAQTYRFNCCLSACPFCNQAVPCVSQGHPSWLGHSACDISLSGAADGFHWSVSQTWRRFLPSHYFADKNVHGKFHSLVFLSLAVALSLGACSQQQPATVVIMRQQEKRQCCQPLIIPSFVQQLSPTDLNTEKITGYYCSPSCTCGICSGPRLVPVSWDLISPLCRMMGGYLALFEPVPEGQTVPERKPGSILLKFH